MKKIILSLATLSSVLVLLAASLPALAVSNPQIPEVDGTYNDPEHPGTKVRVIVHRAKAIKPGGPSTAAPALVCGLADPASSSVVPAGGWKLPANWTYNLNPASVPSTVDGANLAAIAGNGFSDWHTATGNAVNFTRGSDTSKNRQAYDLQNIVAWGRTSGSALGVTYIRYNSATKVAVDVDTIMNKSFKWYWSASSSCAYSGVYDAENILNHELGHWVGLDDTYTASFQDNTMFGYGSTGEVKKNTLTAGDSAGASQIYN